MVHKIQKLRRQPSLEIKPKKDYIVKSRHILLNDLSSVTHFKQTMPRLSTPSKQFIDKILHNETPLST